jgi:hypothetical protein
MEMAQLFLTPGKEGEGRLLLLQERAYALDPSSDCPRPAPVEQACGDPQGAALLRSSDSSGRDLWIAVDNQGSGLRINGFPLSTGARVLCHRDELRIGEGEAAYFSTERLATIEAYGADDEPVCPRCRGPVLRGQLSVSCPDCRVRYHQDDGVQRPCWQYAPSCATCSAPTDPDAGFRWTPEGL